MLINSTEQWIQAYNSARARTIQSAFEIRMEWAKS